MKVYEAIAMLEQVDQNKECIVTFGTPTKVVRDEYFHTDLRSPYMTKWVIGKEQWPVNPNVVTCKLH